MKIKIFAGAAALLISSLAVAHATPTEFVTNGNFELSSYKASNQFGGGYGGQGVTGWTGTSGYNIYFKGGTATTTAAYTQYGPLEKLYSGPGFNGNSPMGGNFVALDGEQNSAQGGISQLIKGLTINETYKLTFDWGAGQVQSRSGATTEKLQVSLGNETYTTATVNNPSKSFTGWMSETFIFTATSANETLKFLSIGTPSGLPPIATLDGVSLTEVPEPTSMALLGVGLTGLALRRRRAASK